MHTTAAPFKIDPEFKSLLIPLRDDERQQLEDLLIAEGCRDALVVWVPPPGKDEPCEECDGQKDILDDDALRDAIYAWLSGTGAYVRQELSKCLAGDWVWVRAERSKTEGGYLDGDASGWACRRCGAVCGWDGRDAILIDGHNRYEICERRHIDYNLSPMPHPDRLSAMIWIRENQLARRNLSDDQRAISLALLVELRSQQSKQERARKAGETGGRNHPKLSLVDDVSTKLNPSAARIRTETAKEHKIPERKLKQAAILLKNDMALAKKVERGEVALMQASRDHRKAERDKDREVKAKQAEAAVDTGDNGVLVADFRELAKTIPPDSVELVFADPPYDRGSLPLYEDMAKAAAEILRDGGSLICYAGQYLLPDIIPMMQKHLRFWWLCACVHTGQLARMNSYGVVVGWKPLLWFVKSKRADTQVFVSDTILSEREKSQHDWQQGEIDAAHFIEKLTQPGDMVFDPFCGGGTTAAVCKRIGRRWLTCDVDEKSAKIARKRVHDVKPD